MSLFEGLNFLNNLKIKIKAKIKTNLKPILGLSVVLLGSGKSPFFIFNSYNY